MGKQRHKEWRPRKSTAAEWKECQCGKRGHTSRGAAKRAMGPASNKIRVYRCPASGLWHATSQLEKWEDYEFES